MSNILFDMHCIRLDPYGPAGYCDPVIPTSGGGTSGNTGPTGAAGTPGGPTGAPGPTGPSGFPCANAPLQIAGPMNCVEIIPSSICGGILQNIGGVWGIYRSPGITEVTVGFGGNNIAPGANYGSIAAAVADNMGNSNCLFIRVVDTSSEVGNIVTPAGQSLLIYVDPGVSWTVTGLITIDDGQDLVIMGALSQNSSELIFDTGGATFITGNPNINVMNIRLTNLTGGLFTDATNHINIENVFYNCSNTASPFLNDALSVLDISIQRLVLVGGGGACSRAISITNALSRVSAHDIEIQGTWAPAIPILESTISGPKWDGIIFNTSTVTISELSGVINNVQDLQGTITLELSTDNTFSTIGNNIDGLASLALTNQNITADNVRITNLNTVNVADCTQLSNVVVDTLTGPLIGAQELHVRRNSQYNSIKVNSNNIIVTGDQALFIGQARTVINNLNATSTVIGQGSITFTGVDLITASNVISYRDININDCFESQFSNLYIGRSLTGAADANLSVENCGRLEFSNVFVNNDIVLSNIDINTNFLTTFDNLVQRVNSALNQQVFMDNIRVKIDGFSFHAGTGSTNIRVRNTGAGSTTVLLSNGNIVQGIQFGESAGGASALGRVSGFLSNCIIGGTVVVLVNRQEPGLVMTNCRCAGLSYDGGGNGGGLVTNTLISGDLTIGSAVANDARLGVSNSLVTRNIFLRQGTQECKLTNIGCLVGTNAVASGDIIVSGTEHTITNLAPAVFDYSAATSFSAGMICFTGATNCILDNVVYQGIFCATGGSQNCTFSNMLISGTNRNQTPWYPVQSFEVFGRNHRLNNIQLGSATNLTNLAIPATGATAAGYLTGGFGTVANGNYRVIIGNPVVGSENIQVDNLTIYPSTGQAGINTSTVAGPPPSNFSIQQTINNIEFNVRNSQISNAHIYYSPTNAATGIIAGHTGITGTTVFVTPATFNSKFSNCSIGYGNENATMTGVAGNLFVGGPRTFFDNTCVNNTLTATGAFLKFGNMTTNQLIHAASATGCIYTGCEILQPVISTVFAPAGGITMVGNNGPGLILGYPAFLSNPGMGGTNI